MLTFKGFQQLLVCGGNVVVNGQAAEKIDIRIHNRQAVTNDIKQAMLALNRLYQKRFGKPIWPNTEVLNGHAFNGSSEFLFDPKVTDEFLLKNKPTFGDIDLTVPAEHKENLADLLDKIKGNKVTPNVMYIGNNKEEAQGLGHQINCIFRLTGLPGKQRELNVQIDLEMTEYKADKPSEFTKFAHSSHPADLEVGLKGVAHKFLIGGLVGGNSLLTSQDITLFTKAATVDKPKVSTSKPFVDRGISKHAFGVDRGLRQRLTPVLDHDGNQLVYDGKPVWKEQDTDQSNYITDLLEIAKHMFGAKFDPADINKLWSAVGLIELMEKYSTPQQIQNSFDKIVDTMFGPGAQHLEKAIEGDQKVKQSLLNVMIEAFPFLKTEHAKQKWEEYYAGFETRQKALDAKRGLSEMPQITTHFSKQTYSPTEDEIRNK